MENQDDTLKIFQKGWNFRQDGPGHRLVYHLQGCNLKCPWCSNPEGMSAGGTLMVKHDILVAEVCPHGAIRDREVDRNICLETNGTHPHLAELFPEIDTLIIDLKHYDDAKMEEFTGTGNATVLENIGRAAESHPRLWLRITLVPGFNSEKKDIDQFVRLAHSLPQHHLAVELLAYHEYGRPKWIQCGMEYRMPAARIERQKVQEYEAMFNDADIRVIKT